MLLEWFFIAAVLSSCSTLQRRRRPIQPLPVTNINGVGGFNLNRPVSTLPVQPPFNNGDGFNQPPQPPPEPTISSITSLQPNKKPSKLPPSRPSTQQQQQQQQQNQPAIRPPKPQKRPPRPPSSPTERPNSSSRLIYNVNRRNPDGSYFFDFLDGNSNFRQEQGFFKSVLDRSGLKTDQVFVKTGTYGFTSPEGMKFRVNFIADENGYRAFQGHSQ